MSNAPTGFSELKQRMRAMWMAGDFGLIARNTEREGQVFIERLNLKPRMRVLDVACGTGNQSLPAARTGAQVTGLDIAPNLLEQARARAQEEQLAIEFVEGDAEQLPHSDKHFDVVLSMFGAMFAPRPEMVASELVRVCRPGGVVAMANWTREGFVGKIFEATAKHVPPPPGVPAPTLWGDEGVVAQRFASKARLETQRREVRFDYPSSPAEVVEIFRSYFGPTKTAFARLNADGQKALAEDMVRLWTDYNEGDASHTVVRGEYLDVRGTVN